MTLSIFFTRVFFALLSIVFMSVYALSLYGQAGWVIGLVLGLTLTGALIGFEMVFRRSNLRTFNVLVIGLFVGYLMGQALQLIFTNLLDFTLISDRIAFETIEVIKIVLFMFGLYLGTLMTMKASDQIYISVPFFRFQPTTQLKKDVITDICVLSDPRLIDLCSSHIFDYTLVIPLFLIKELLSISEAGSEKETAKAKQALDVIERLKGMDELNVRIQNTDFSETRDMQGKLLRLARLINAHILTADIDLVQTPTIEGIHFINLHTLSNALKPLMQTGQHMDIKIQRPGKEPGQGVGYLDDGAMVVVNGGGTYIGETIEVKVLSVKHTSSGRIIFCNALDEDEYEE